jgi:hypothetical protein
MPPLGQDEVGADASTLAATDRLFAAAWGVALELPPPPPQAASRAVAAMAARAGRMAAEIGAMRSRAYMESPWHSGFADYSGYGNNINNR